MDGMFDGVVKTKEMIHYEKVWSEIPDEKKEWVRLVQNIQLTVDRFKDQYNRMMKCGMATMDGFVRLQNCSAIYEAMRYVYMPYAKQIRGEEWIKTAYDTAKWMVKVGIWSDFPQDMSIEKMMELGKRVYTNLHDMMRSIRGESESIARAADELCMNMCGQ